MGQTGTRGLDIKIYNTAERRGIIKDRRKRKIIGKNNREKHSQ